MQEEVNLGSYTYGTTPQNESNPLEPKVHTRPQQVNENQVNETQEYETQEYDNSRVNTDNPNDNVLSFFSKLKSKKGNVDTNSSFSSSSGSIPLDDIMNSRSDDENENDNHNHNHIEGMQLKVYEVRELREMQKYVILEQRIKSIHDDMVEIKKNQELILSLLEKKLH